MGKDKEDVKGKRRDRFKRLWTRPNGDHERSPSSRPPTNEVISPDNVPIAPASIVETEPVVSHSSEQIKQVSSETGLWAKAADSLGSKDREKLDKIVGCNQKSPRGNKGHSLAEDVDSTLARAEKLRGETVEATWKPVVDKIIKGALAFKSVGDAAIAFDKSGYAALGWSVVSFGLRVTANTEEAREFVLSSSEIIARFMAKYRQYEKIFRGPDAGEEFDRLLINVYKAMLLYMIALDKYLQQSGPGRFAQATYKLEDRAIKSSKEAIDIADAEISHWLLIISQKRHDHNFSQIRRMLQDCNLRRTLGPSGLQDCLRSLSFPGMEDRFNDIERATEGTCKWLLRHRTYREWADGHSDLLCVRGKPGSGKSTLLRYAVGDAVVASNIRDRSLFLHSEELRKRRETTEVWAEPGALILSFFFHARGAELQKTTLGLYRSLLHQLLRHAPHAIPDDLLTSFKDKKEKMGEPGEGWHWHWRELRDFFQAALRKALKNRPVSLIIDALDEYGKDNATELIKSFSLWIQEFPGPSQLRICFSCRHHPSLVLPKGSSEIWLEQENNYDISTYVQSQLSAWSSSEHLDAIQTDITNRASGVFLWARLIVARVLDLQAEGENWVKIREEVDQSPLELNDLYRGLIEKAADKRNSFKLIQWICYAIEPMTLDELRWAMVVEPEHSYCPNSLQHYETTRHFASNCDMMAKKLTTLSCGLAETIPSSRIRVVRRIKYFDDYLKPYDTDESGSEGSEGYTLERKTIPCRVVQFIHQSVKDFFLKEGLLALQRSQDPAMAKINGAELEATSHKLLSRTCIRYLTAEEIMQSKASVDEIMSVFPLLHYAATYWIGHVQESEKDRPQVDLLDYFGWPSEDIVQHWTRFFESLSRYNDPPLHGSTLLHVASRYRLMGLLRDILRRKQLLQKGIDVIDGNGLTSMSLAVREGHEVVVRLLLESGADVNANGKVGEDLRLASSSGIAGIVRILLENGADANAPASRFDTDGNALQAASANGHEQVARLLLDNGADVNAQGGLYDSALVAASLRGHGHVVEMLLENGADVNAPGRLRGRALTAAIAGGARNEGIVRMLLEKGADANAPVGDFDQRKPVDVAADVFHRPMLKLLREYGAV